MSNQEVIINQAQQNRRQASSLLRLTNEAGQALSYASEKLRSARNWGIVDILGGGFITNLIKHSKLDTAMGYIRQAQPAVRELASALRQTTPEGVSLPEIGTFAVMADFFFDGLLSDVYVQSRIANLSQEVDYALSVLEDIAAALRRLDEYEARRIDKAMAGL